MAGRASLSPFSVQIPFSRVRAFFLSTARWARHPVERNMRKTFKTAIAALMLAGGAMFAAPASAQSFGLGIGPHGGITFSYDSGGYCDDWGCPDDFWDMPVYYGPVFWDGYWYDGPVYYRIWYGQRQYWIHGAWRYDQWRGSRPDWWRPGRLGPALGMDFYRTHNFRGRWEDERRGFNRGFDNRGFDNRAFDNRRFDNARPDNARPDNERRDFARPENRPDFNNRNDGRFNGLDRRDNGAQRSFAPPPQQAQPQPQQQGREQAWRYRAFGQQQQPQQQAAPQAQPRNDNRGDNGGGHDNGNGNGRGRGRDR
jgi:hypothetical protein